MASNEIPDSYNDLVSLAEDAADGAQTHGVAIGLSQNTEAKIRTDLITLIGDPTAVPPVPGKQGIFTAAKSAKPAKTLLKNQAERNARAFATTAVNILKPHLGTQWNSQWQAAGFVSGSLAIPDNPLPLLGQLRDYFTAHPAQENAPLNITAALAQAQITALSNARSAANDSNTAMGIAKAERDSAQRALYKRMSGLLAELSQLLTPDDPLWYAFGFDRPADGQQPGPIDDLVLTPGSAGMVYADWEDARRAARYRVFKQISGTDPAPVQVANAVIESEYTLTALPSGATVQITIVAVNDAGEGVLPATATMVVP
ncbi:fibronectin type III domain-containing protein [Phragmitibacter flavus]|uniref:Fibronectin type III domain-containing protein n=1 Tax=Phragmitibacter flavus TaxID=2576071 RepID=A0A5R8KHE7_9BACT|nr:fibronectin type III domain-containing protein [Phragmitibacter flavus]TLD71734.1 fibronectin type III domain-containing protein [Phragmitibacter flavus]